MFYCCEEHVEIALDEVVDEKMVAPVINKAESEEERAKPCFVCGQPSTYIVGN